MSVDVKKIYTTLPDEIKDMHPHGQWLFDTPGLVLNFLTDVVDDHIPVTEPWAERLVAFLRSDEDLLAFESPHTPGVNYLHKAAAAHIIATIPAWSRKVLARQRPNGDVQVIQSENGLPVLRKLRN